MATYNSRIINTTDLVLDDDDFINVGFNSGPGAGLYNSGTATIIGATFTGNTANMYGGAIYNATGSTVTITDSHINDNDAQNGAAYYGDSNSQLTVSGSTFTANTAHVHAAVYVNDATASFANSLFQANRAKGDHGNDGILYATGNSRIDISGSTFSANTVERYGGAIALGSNATLSATNTYFFNNEAEMGAGAIDIESGNTVVLNGCTMSENYSAANGGAILNDGTFTMRNVVADGNTASQGGGFLYNYASGLTEVFSSTISNSYAGGAGGAIRDVGGTVTLHNSLIKDSVSQNQGGAIAVYSHLNIEGSTFSGNRSESGAAGAIELGPDSDVTITNSLFERNEATTNGGVFSIETGCHGVNISGSTFTDNQSGNIGGAFFLDSNTSVNITDSSFISNSGFNASVIYLSTGSTVSFDNVLIQGNTTSCWWSGAETAAVSLNGDATVSVTGSTFSGNVGGKNSAILNNAGTSVTVEDSQFLTATDRITVKGDTTLTGDITTAADIAVQGTGVLTVDDVNLTFTNTEDISVGTMTLANDGVLSVNFNNSGTVNFTNVDLSGKPISIDTNNVWPSGTWVVADGITSVNNATFTVNGVNATLGNPLPNGAILDFVDGGLTLSIISYIVTLTNTLDDCLEVAASAPGLITFDAETDGTTCTFAGATISHDQTLQGNGATNTTIQPYGASLGFANGHELVLDALAVVGNFYGGSRNADTTGTSLTFQDAGLQGNLFGGGRAESGNDVAMGTVTLSLTDTTQAAGKAIYGGGYANGGTASIDSISLVLDNVDGGTNSVYGGGAVNGGGKLDVGPITTEISGGVHGAIFNGANIYTSGANFFNAGTMELDITGGTFTGAVGNGSTPRDNSSSRQGASTLNISGGLFQSIVYGGAVSFGTATTNATVASTSVTISGGTFNGKIFGGNVGQAGSKATNTVLTGNSNLTIDCSSSDIYLNANVIGGSMGSGIVGGSVTVTVTGNGSNLHFGSSSFLSGDSEYAYGNVSYVERGKTLVFDDFSGVFNANFQGPAFDTVTVRNGSVVNVCGGAVNQDFGFVRIWNFELSDSNAVMITDDVSATNVKSSFYGATINLTFADGATVGAVDWTVYQGSEATLNYWNELGALTIAGVDAEGEMDGDFMAWTTSDYRVYVDSNYDIRLAKLA